MKLETWFFLGLFMILGLTGVFALSTIEINFKNYEFELEFIPLEFEKKIMVPQWDVCERDVIDRSICLAYGIGKNSSECISHPLIKKEYDCISGYHVEFIDVIYRNQTLIKLVTPKQTLIFDGICCGVYNESPYRAFSGRVISCKQELTKICNPLIQQSNINPLIFDEDGLIFVIKNNEIQKHFVGQHQYLKTNPFNYAVTQ